MDVRLPVLERIGVRRIARSFVAVGLLLSAAASGPRIGAASVLGPQQTAQTQVFRSRIDIMRVDVTVVDNKTGRPIGDLTERDFSITENGARQNIAAFAPEIITATTGPVVSAPIVRGRDMAPRDRRIFMIVLHGAVFQVYEPVKPLEGVIRFIRERLLPQDLVGVMVYNRATELTTDHEYVAQVVERLKARKDDLALALVQQAARREGDIPPGLQADIDAIFQPPGTNGHPPRSVTSMLLGTQVFRDADDTSRPRPWNRLVIGSDLLKVQAAIEHLRPLDGEKHIVCLTPGLRMPSRVVNMPTGLFLDSREDDERVARRANDAQVTLDVIHTLGVVAGQAFDIMAAENLARLTGGEFTGTRVADQALARIDDEARVGYVLGYTPSNPDLDQKYRAVEVKVNRKDVTVLYRRGYTAQAEPPPLDVREAITSSRLLAAAAADVEEHDIKLDVQASNTRVNGAQQVRVELTIDATRLTLEASGGQREGAIDLVILCGDAKQKVVGRLRQHMAIGLDQAHYDVAMRSGIPYATAIPVTAPATTVKVLVYDYGADLIGTSVVRVK